MTAKLYDLSAVDDIRFSPFCWRTKFALAHKGVPYDTVPIGFGDKDKLEFSGQDRVPVLVEGETVVADSWAIACYLEDNYSEGPSLFGGDGGRSVTRFVNNWADQVMLGPMARLIGLDTLQNHVPDSDKSYWRESRESRLGATLEELHAARDDNVIAFRACLGPIRASLSQGAFLAGGAPAYADYIVFGNFQWARNTSPFQLLEKDDPIYAWRSRMLDLFDGLAAKAPGYPV